LKLNLIIINAKNAKFLSKPFLGLFSNNILWFLIPACFFILSMIFFVNYDEIFKNLKNSSIENIFLYVGIMIISSLFHELGHTTATYKFGGHHSGIGIGFYLFTPVLYADVSSVWKFDANKRIVVNLAGIYFELLLSTLLILVSLIISFKPLMTISMMILIKTLYNFNPFFRTDGYWVLSDAIRIPNLRTTSNELLKKVIKKLNFNLTKKQAFLVIYALISNSFILFFLLYLFIINPSSLLTFPVDTYLYIIGIINNKIVFSLVNVAPLLTPLVFYILVIRLGFDYIKKWKNEKNY
jgi:putative peptide zinc metalloprotease protein